MIDYTVLMSVYIKDQSDLVRASLNSCEQNIKTPSQYLIYCDGPITDEVSSVIEEFARLKNVTIFKNKNNNGLTYALNFLLEHVQTEWFARVDADDINVPGRFDLQCAFLSKNHVDVLGGQIIEKDRDGRTIEKIKKVPEKYHAILKMAKLRNPMNHMTVMARTDIIRSHEGYPNINGAEDYALWAKLLVSGVVLINMSDVLVYATVDKDFYKRRGGIKYVISQFKLQLFFKKVGLIGAKRAIINFALRSIIFLLPPIIRMFIYKKMLRT